MDPNSLTVELSQRRVAQAVQVSIPAVLDLGAAFESTLRRTICEIVVLPFGEVDEETVASTVQEQDLENELTELCERMLADMGLAKVQLSLNSVQVGTIWPSVIQLLQIGVLSYAGAHIQQFDLDRIGSVTTSFSFPLKITYYDEGLRAISSKHPSPQSGFQLRRRQLQCLDKFLGGVRPWIFHQWFEDEGDERLYLATTIHSLTDLWGPSWRVDEGDKILRCDIGNGVLVPRPNDSDIQLRCALNGTSEVLCHWLPFHDWYQQCDDREQTHPPKRTSTLLAFS